ncbi:hypothetical protein BDN70DRAFT_890508 [Pholiota conissans]|uniref:MYND-type domain-containing protein n=1 Tax=Pholiota conissans TaxID=109636 RepID=A0A9P5ZFU2_9AGAR|nr:hypothetical protein BDN70DRAFT_890508 [Pholiota conissans]
MPYHRLSEGVDLESQLKIGSTVVIRHPSEMAVEPQTSKEIKKIMKTTKRSCAQCKAFESENLVCKTCSKCQAVFYCSVECQRLHWPAHKVHCPQSRKLDRVEKLAYALTANRNFFTYLKLAIIFQFNLLTAKRPIEPFCALVPLTVEPEDILDFARLRGDIPFERPTNPHQKMKGILQVGGVLPYPEEQYFKDKARSLTEAAMDANPSLYCRPDSIHVVVRFSMVDPARDGPGMMIEIPIIITPNLMDIARAAQPFGQCLPIAAHFFSKPMDAFSCVEYINSTIRQDRENRFLMRREMTEEDEELIRRSTAEFNQETEMRFSSMIIELRMRNEQIYKPLIHDLL